MLDDLISLSQTFLRVRNREFRRYFLEQHPTLSRFSVLVGPRGVGKTTALIQYLHDPVHGAASAERALYVQADHFLVGKTTLYEIADEFHKLGGTLVCFDEIHKYPAWSTELKSICDTFPGLTILASGSSALDVVKGSHDLSRRAVVYRMHGLSFREFLALRGNLRFPAVPLEELLQKHRELAAEVTDAVERSGRKVLSLFKSYLERGFYPYFLEYEDKALFWMTLEQGVHATLENDLPAVHSALSGASVAKIRRLLSVVAGLVPFTPELHKLRALVDVGDDRTLKTYLKYLDDAGVLLAVSSAGRGLGRMAKPQKLYLGNPNLYFALAPGRAPDAGTLRETFFLNMTLAAHEVAIAPQGDFVVDGRFMFEVGGKAKGARQLAGADNAWLALDSLEVGHGNRVPLWLLGFLY